MHKREGFYNPMILVIILCSIKSVFSNDTNDDVYFYVGLEKGTSTSKIKSLNEKFIFKYCQKLSEVKNKWENNELDTICGFSWDGEIKNEIGKLLDYIFDNPEINLLPDKKLLMRDFEFKNFIIDKYNDHYKKEESKEIKHARMCVIFTEIEDNIIGYFHYRHESEKHFFYEFSIVGYSLFNEKRTASLDYIPETMPETYLEERVERKSNIMIGKLSIHDISLSDLFCGDDKIIEILEKFLNDQLKAHPTANIFIVINFEPYILPLLIAINKQTSKNECENHLYDIPGYIENMKIKCNRAKSIKCLHKIIKQNPRLKVKYPCTLSHYENWIGSLTHISTTVEEWKYFISELDILKEDLDKLRRLIDEFMFMVLFNKSIIRKDVVIDSDILSDVKKIKLND